MDVFQYARDYYGDWLPARLLPASAALLVWLIVLCLGIHLLRRSRSQPASTGLGPEDLLKGDAARKYEVTARLYHWGNAGFLAALAVSGIALFVPGSLKPFKVTWLLVHEAAAVLFIAGLALHIAVAPRHGRGRTMWFERSDWRDLRTIVANFFGRTRQYPAFGKYDPLQKLYHAWLTILSAGMIFSGAFLLLSAEVWATFSHSWLRWQRLIHDLGAFLLIGIVIGHIYFGIIRVNWPSLKAIITGWVPAAHFNRYHSTRRWHPAERDTGESDDHTS